MADEQQPSLIVLAGPNGAGKSTLAPRLLQGVLGVEEFVNADTIAQGISAFHPERAAIHAGRVMLERIRELANQRANFAIETTLAGKSYLRRFREMRRDGYFVHLIFLWLPSVELALDRVRRRVSLGGHDIPIATVRRRYTAGLRNFWPLYRSHSDFWQCYDGSPKDEQQLIAFGEGNGKYIVKIEAKWQQFQNQVQS